jgi:HK97 family phage prohead protease
MNKNFIISHIEIEKKEIDETQANANQSINENYSLNKVFIIKGTANSGQKDRASDIMPKSCWDLANFLKNPILLYNHDYASPVGKITELYATETGLKFTAEIGHVDTEMTEIQANTVKLIKQGVLKTFSVGFIGHDYDYDKQNQTYIYKNAELLEISIVSVPMDANATLDSFFSKQINSTKGIKMLDDIKVIVEKIKEELANLSTIISENEQLKAEVSAKSKYISELENVIIETQKIL